MIWDLFSHCQAFRRTMLITSPSRIRQGKWNSNHRRVLYSVCVAVESKQTWCYGKRSYTISTDYSASQGDAYFKRNRMMLGDGRVKNRAESLPGILEDTNKEELPHSSLLKLLASAMHWCALAFSVESLMIFILISWIFLVGLLILELLGFNILSQEDLLKMVVVSDCS